MRRGLVVPDDLAIVGVNRQRGGGVEVVALAQVAVPRRRIAGAEEDQVGFRVIGAAQPGGAAAGLPQVARPGGVELAGHAVGLAAQGAHVAFDHRPRPHQLAGVDVARLDHADRAEFTARYAGDDQALDDQRRGGLAVAGLVIGDGLVPDDLAGLAVERHDMGVERAEDDLVAIDRRATVDHVAAGHDAVGQAGIVFPLLFPGARVEGEDAGIGARDIDHAVIDDRLRFLAALLFPAERGGKGRHHLGHVGGVDLGKRAEPVRLRPHAIGQHIAGGGGVGHQVRIARASGWPVRQGRRCHHQGQRAGGRRLEKSLHHHTSG